MEDELKSSSSSVSQYAGEVEGGDGSSCSRDRHSDIDSDDEWTLDDMGASDNTLPPVSPLEWQAISLINQKPSSSPPLLSRPPSSPSFPFLSFCSLPFPSVSYHLQKPWEKLWRTSDKTQDHFPRHSTPQPVSSFITLVLLCSHLVAHSLFSLRASSSFRRWRQTKRFRVSAQKPLFFLSCLPLCCVAATKKKIQRMKARAADDTHTRALQDTHDQQNTGVVESLLCRKGQAGKRPPAPVNGTQVYRACPTQGTPSSPIIGHRTTPDPLRNASNSVRADLPALVHLGVHPVLIDPISRSWSTYVCIESRNRPSTRSGPPRYGASSSVTDLLPVPVHLGLASVTTYVPGLIHLRKASSPVKRASTGPVASRVHWDQ